MSRPARPTWTYPDRRPAAMVDRGPFFQPPELGTRLLVPARVVLEGFEEENGSDHHAHAEVAGWLSGKQRVRGRVKQVQRRSATMLDGSTRWVMGAQDALLIVLEAGPYAIRTTWALAREVTALRAARRPLRVGPEDWLKRP